MDKINNPKNIKIAKFMIWCTIFQIPVYTLLFYNSKILFWSFLVLERIISLILICNSMSIDKIIEDAMNESDTDLVKLTIFSVVCTVICYTITFMKHKELFLIISLAEISDMIVRKLLEDKEDDSKKKSNKNLFNKK